MSQRRLVLSYLCHQCHANTARAFIRDSRRIADLAGCGSVSNGMESGYGTWPIDRDLKTGNALPPPEIITTPPEPARQHSTQSMEDVVTSTPAAEAQNDYKAVDMDTITIPTSDIRTTLEGTPEPQTPRLNDRDIDEDMTPPPGEEHEPQHPSIDQAFSQDVSVDVTPLVDGRHASDAIEVDAKPVNGIDVPVVHSTEPDPITSENDSTGCQRGHAEVDLSEVEMRKGNDILTPVNFNLTSYRV